MDDLQQDPAGIAGGHEARHRGRHHHRIAHQHIGRGLPHALFRPGHRHHLDRAVERRQIERRAGIAVGPNFHWPGEVRHQFLGRRVRFQPCLRAGVPPGAHLPLNPRQTVDQAAIDVADAHTQLALAKVVALRIGGVIGGQVQDAHIDGGNGDIGDIARRHAIDLDRDIQRAAWGRFRSHLDRGLQGARAGVDPGIGEAQRARRIAPRRHVHGPDHRGGDIGPGPPFIGHRHRDQVFARRHLDRLHRDHPVRQDRDHRGARRTGDDAQHCRVTGFVTGLVQRQLQRVGRRRHIRRRIPARPERRRRFGIAAGVGLADRQFILAPGHRTRHLQRILAQIGSALGHHRAADHGFPVPLAVLLIPLVLRLDPGQFPLDRHRHRGFLRPDGQQVEHRLVPLARHAVEQGLDPDHRTLGQQHRFGAAFHRTARPLGQPHGEPCLQWPVGLARIGDQGGSHRLTVRIRPLAAERFKPRVERGVLAPEHIAGILRQPLCGAQQHLALNRQIGTGGTEQVLRVDRQIGRLTGAQGGVGQGQGKVDAFRQEILDQEGCRRQGRCIRLGQHLEPPLPAWGRCGDGQVEDIAAARIGDELARVFHAVGAFQHGGQGDPGNRLGLRIPRKGCRMHRLADAVGAAFGHQEHVHRGGRFAPFDPPVGQVELGVGQ